MTKKLTTSLLSPDPAGGRKLIRSMNGKSLTRIVDPVSIFWTYDDHGEDDPDLEIWCTYRSAGTGVYIHSNEFYVSGRLNLPGLSYPLYTHDLLINFLSSRGMGNCPIRMWAFLDDESRSRGMTFWVFGKKIHVTACFASLYEDLDHFIGRIEISEDRRFTVNGEYRGVWPRPS